MNIQTVLTGLCGQPGPSGFEGPAARYASELLRPLVDEVRVDCSGNVVGVRRCGCSGARKLLLDAHLDEVGMMVTGVEDGFLRFRKIGGIDPRVLTDREVTVLTEPPIFGVVSCLPPHVLKEGESDKAPSIDQLCIDIGMSQVDAERAVPVGTTIVYRQDCFTMGEDLLCGKALDDRSCFTALLRAVELLRDRPLDIDLYILGSACEEVGGWGAMTAAYGAAPDFCVAVDVTFAKAPDCASEVSCELGKGPAVGIGPVIPRWMSDRMRQKAVARNIAWQPEVMSGRTGTNGDDFQISREGVATAVLSLPLKYMHTPIEVISLRDVESTARLLAAFAEDLGREAPTVC